MSNSGTALSTPHPSFAAIRQEKIESLNIRVEQYKHKKTGAVH